MFLAQAPPQRLAHDSISSHVSLLSNKKRGSPHLNYIQYPGKILVVFRLKKRHFQYFREKESPPKKDGSLNFKLKTIREI